MAGSSSHSLGSFEMDFKTAHAHGLSIIWPNEAGSTHTVHMVLVSLDLGHTHGPFQVHIIITCRHQCKILTDSKNRQTKQLLLTGRENMVAYSVNVHSKITNVMWLYHASDAWRWLDIWISDRLLTWCTSFMQATHNPNAYSVTCMCRDALLSLLWAWTDVWIHRMHAVTMQAHFCNGSVMYKLEFNIDTSQNDQYSHTKVSDCIPVKLDL